MKAREYGRGIQGGAVVKNLPDNTGDRRDRREFNPYVRKIPWRREWLPTPVFLPGDSHGQRSLADYSPWGRKESDTTEQLSTAQERGMLQNLYIKKFLQGIPWWSSD